MQATVRVGLARTPPKCLAGTDNRRHVPYLCVVPGSEAMALMITDECINCDVCEPECPNDAIYMGELIYENDPHKCTECVGHFDEPQCMQVCPVSCIPVNPEHVEDRETLMQKYHRLQAEVGKN